MGGAVGREGGGQCLLMSDPVGLVSAPLNGQQHRCPR